MKRILVITAVLLSGLSASSSYAAVPARSADPPSLSSQSDDPLAGVEALILAGRHGEAQAAAERARRIFGQRQDRAREAHAVLVLAAAKLVAGDFAGAAADCETSASMLERPGDRFSRWIALWHLGLLKGAQKQLNDAIAQHRSALAVLREIETSPEPLSADGLKYLGGYLGRYFQMPPDILRLPPTQPEIAKPKLLRIAEVMTRRALLDALLSASQLEEAEAELSRLGELSQQLGGVFSKEVVLYRGTLRRLQWRLDEAREIFRQALVETGLAPGLELEILASLIELEIVSRRLEEALALTDRALGLARRHGAASEEAKFLLFRAHILRESKQLGDAEADLLKSLDLAKRSGKVYEQALVHQQLGFLALTEGRPEQAAVQFEAAARLFQEGNRPEEEARIRLQLSQIYAQLNARTSAEAALARARELAGKIGSRWVLAMADVLGAVERSRAGTGTMAEVEDSLLALLALPEVREVQPSEHREKLVDLMSDLSRVLDGRETRPSLSTRAGGEEEGFAALRGIPRLIRGFAHFERDQFAEARRLWLAALAEEPRNDIKIVLLAFTGFSYTKEGNDEAAIRSLAQAVEVVEKTVEDVRLEELLAGYLGSEKQFLFAELIDSLTRKGRTVEAFEYAERARARAFLQGLGNPRLTIPQGADPKLARDVGEVREQIIKLQRQRASASAADQKRLSSELMRARETYQSLLVRLKVTNRDGAPWTPVEPQQIPAIREQLGPDTSLISYFVSSSRIYAWVLDQKELRHVTLPLDPQDLRRAVCWADQFGQPGRSARIINSQCGADLAQAEEIYEKLIAPLRGFIRHRRLIVIPHGELHYLPFAALRDPQTGRYLVEDFTLTYAPSASAIGFLRGKETAVRGTAWVFKAPEELDSKLGDLDAARREADLFVRLFGAQSETREGLLYQRIGEVDLLHIAAHGIYEPRSPLFSHIALAAGQGHDGNLEVHEILDLNLAGVNLVVLSACDTARGERSRGDEITSLTRAFLYAGSPGVISTLWSIDDEATAVLMEEFYTRLLAGASAADALRQAQLALLRSPLYKDPRFWAAFSLAGDPQGKWTQSHGKVKP